jgi:hypothetical protein
MRFSLSFERVFSLTAAASREHRVEDGRDVKTIMLFKTSRIESGV